MATSATESKKVGFQPDGLHDNITIKTGSVTWCARADLGGTIFAYNCCMCLAHVMSATQMRQSKC